MPRSAGATIEFGEMRKTQEHAGGLRRASKPLYQDFHASCSVLVGRFCNEAALLGAPAEEHFTWLHRFYAVLDAVAQKHQVYKLHGGSHGFLLSTGVAEPDANHASHLLACALHLLRVFEPVRMPGREPARVVMTLASGTAASGLLGSQSLTYQIVGRPMSAANEVAQQQALPLAVTGDALAALPPEQAACLVPAGSLPLRCTGGQQEALFTLPRFAGEPLTLAEALGAPEAAAAAGGEPGAKGKADGRADGGAGHWLAAAVWRLLGVGRA